jgi:acyl-CoA reductase-like NAD-dependent aldehyde dehydrogenase
LSAARFAAAMIAEGLPCPSLLHFDSTSDADTRMLRHLIAQTDQSVVFGEDRTVRALYEVPVAPPHKPIPHWSGRSGALLLPDADLELAVRSIVHGATEDRGNRCISTKKAFVPRALASKFEGLLVANAEALRRGEPTTAATDIGRCHPAARAAAEAAAFDGEVVYSRDFLATRCARGSRALRDEIPYPLLGIEYYENEEDAVASANASVAGTPSGRALAMAVFTGDREAFLRAAGGLSAFKVLRNAPTTQMDYRTRHQGIFLHRELMRELEVCS